MRFIILSPRSTAGGSIVLHELCRAITSEGHHARMAYYDYLAAYCNKTRIESVKWARKTLIWDKKKELQIMLGHHKSAGNGIGDFEPYLNSAFSGTRHLYLPRKRNNAIVVYPEIVHGNPLDANRVVRWLLYENSYSATEKKAIRENDLVFSYRDVFNDASINPNNRKLNIQHYDLSIYKRMNYDARSGTCYIVRKGRNRGDLPSAFDGPVIDNFSEQEKVDVFNKCVRCISYDTQTAYAGLAALCGCQSIVVPEPGKTRDDYLKEDDKAYGVAYGFSDTELTNAAKTALLLPDYYRKANAASRGVVRKFIDECRVFFTEKEKYGKMHKKRLL